MKSLLKFSCNHRILFGVILLVSISVICSPAHSTQLEIDLSLAQLAREDWPLKNILTLQPISEVARNFFIKEAKIWKLYPGVYIPIFEEWIDQFDYLPENQPDTRPQPYELSNIIGEDSTSKLDPLLRLLFSKNRKYLQGMQEKLNLIKFLDLIALYSNKIPTSRPAFNISELSSFSRISSPEANQKLMAEKVGVLIKTKTSGTSLLNSEVDITTIAGDIVTARVSLDELMELVNRKDVVYIEASHRLELELDKSIPVVGADVLHNENPSVAGSDVTIGIVDTGIDYDHLDFREDTDGDQFEESSRIRFIWDQTEGFGTPPSGFHYGTEYTKHQIESDVANGYDSDNGLVREADDHGHGTHVAGIAASDGSSSGLNLAGVAPRADLIAVKSSFTTADVVDGVNYIIERSLELNRPVVVNLSLGGHLGPHDGTSLFEQAIDQSIQGRAGAVVTSAGNAGNDKIHISDLLRSDSVSFSFLPYESSVYLDFWYPGGSYFEISVTSPGVNGPAKTLKVRSGSFAHLSTPDGNVWIDNASGGPNPNNKDKEILINLEDIEKGEPWTIQVKDNGGGGRLDGWVALSSMGEFPSGDREMTISEPGNAYKVITVGGFTTKNEWKGRDGNVHHFIQASQVGEIAPFSSYGPTRDGREKPDLTAPGSAIASSLATGSDLSTIAGLVLPDQQHVVMQGTSQAAPHVSGTCVLMLKADPHLTSKDLKNRLKYAAKNDKFTGITPNLRWGAGKLNASTSFDTLGLEISTSLDRPSVKVGPNPAEVAAFFYYDLPPDTKSAKLAIYNIVGITVFSDNLDINKNRYEWDLRNGLGEKLANGLYVFMIISDNGKSNIHRLVIRHR